MSNLLNRNINSIIYQSYLKLGEYATNISSQAREGLDDTKEYNQCVERVIILECILDEVLDHIIVKNNQVYQLLGISIQEMNILLATLQKIAKINDFPTASFIPSKASSIITTGGTQGPPGANGVNSYSAVAFASDSSGTGFSSIPNISLPYVAFKTSSSPISMVAASFTGLWVKYFGNDGVDGVDGVDGQNVYPYIRYADDNAGSNFSITPLVTTQYIAILLSLTDLGPIPSSTVFNGLWTLIKGTDGSNGVDGVDGNTIVYGPSDPITTDGNDGDFFVNTINNTFFGPKALGVWPTGISIIGPIGNTGTNGTNGANGVNSFLYVAWANDSIGTGFTNTFDPNKEYIAFFISPTSITPIQSTFDGLWTKYRGDGDRWATSSATSLTIGTGLQNLIVDLNLAYTTGQRVVIARNTDPTNQMQGYVVSYDRSNGQLSINVDTILGSGTYNVWDVNLFGVPTQIISTSSYFAELYVENNSGGTPQTLSTSYQKLTQFTTQGATSLTGITPNVGSSNIQTLVRGAYVISADLSFSSNTATEFFIQLYKNGSAIAGTISRVTLVASEKKHFNIYSVQNLALNDIIDVRIKAIAATPTFLLEEGRISVSSTGTPGTPNFAQFGPVVANTPNQIADSFLASLGQSVEWKYTVQSGSNRRTGTVTATWIGVSVSHSDINTLSIGSTSDVVFSATLVTGNINLLATVASSGWTISGNRTIIE